MDAITYAASIAYSSRQVLQFSFDMAVKYKDTPGVYVECGVAAGAQVIAMAAGAPNKTIYAFDSFEGIPLPSNKDDQYPGIKFLSEAEQAALPNPGEQVLKSSGATSVSLEDFWLNVSTAFDRQVIINYAADLPCTHRIGGYDIRTVRGWFEFTLNFWENAIPPISILRLDADLYNSTYICLKYLYPKVIKGGIVIIDDWALPGCRAAVYDYFKNKEKYPLPFDVDLVEKSTVAYWYK